MTDIDTEIELWFRLLDVALARTGGDLIKAARLARMTYYLESFDQEGDPR